MCFVGCNEESNKFDICNRNEKASQSSVLTNSNSQSCEVYLQTLIVCIKNNGINQFIRIILDSASQKSYISKFVVEAMKLKHVDEEVVIHGLFGGIEQTEKHKKYVVKLSSIDRNFTLDVEVMDQKQICMAIPKMQTTECINELKNEGIFVSDISMNTNCCLFNEDPNEIHMLLGADYIGRLFTGEIKSLKGGLTAMNTYFGWSIFGKTNRFIKNKFEVQNSTTTALTLHVKETKLSDLWNLDTLGILDPGEKRSRNEIDELTKEHFLRTVKRQEDGRYKVCLPWVEGHPTLPNHRNLAERRLKQCVKSLETARKLILYEEVFDDWEKEKIIEQINPISEIKEGEHFLPHRAVFKETSTTQIRPVFDGSAREKNSPSINDCLEKGPNLVELIPTILTRFRKGKIGVIADIRRAFLQIELNERDRPFLRFLWWEKGDEKRLRIYQHRRVVFGLSCSPYLLGATLEYHLKNAPEHLKETASKLMNAFYVDNCITTVNNEEELEKFIAEAQLVLSSAQFQLRGWEYNRPSSKKDETPMEEKVVPVLGLNWNLNADTLSIDLSNITKDELPVTKRRILSTVHKIFDPTGFTCAVTLSPKVLLQDCWKLKVGWDTELPDYVANKFNKWKRQLSKLTDIAIPRCIFLNKEAKHLTLHVFCDASKIAYACCIFLRREHENFVTCQLLQARSRVAPMKPLSIPRLELLACTIGTRLAQNVKADLEVTEIATYYWTDSENVLYWIKKNEYWSPFVYNRVQEIRSISKPEDWNFVPGHLNPADLPSRGCTAEKLRESRWCEGPEWLKNPREEWPKVYPLPDIQVINSEKRK